MTETEPLALVFLKLCCREVSIEQHIQVAGYTGRVEEGSERIQHYGKLVYFHSSAYLIGKAGAHEEAWGGIAYMYRRFGNDNRGAEQFHGVSV